MNPKKKNFGLRYETRSLGRNEWTALREVKLHTRQLPQQVLLIVLFILTEIIFLILSFLIVRYLFLQMIITALFSVGGQEITSTD